jgi:hypothetical protein
VELLGYRRFETDYRPLLVMQLRDLETGVLRSRKVTGAALQRRVSRERPLPGEKFTLSYGGMTEVQNGPYAGKPCHVWDLVMMDRAPAVPDFEALADGTVQMASGQQDEPDVPIDSGDLPEPPGRQFGDDVPW